MNLEHVDSFPLEATLNFEQITVKGSARISLKSGTCEFSSDFVPLLALDSIVTIDCRFGGVDVFRIIGPTFVSSKRFLRVQPIDVTLCEGAEEVIEVPVKIPVSCVKKHFFSTTYEQCDIVSCSANKISVSGINLSPDKNDNKIRILAGAPLFASQIPMSLTFDDGGMLFGKGGRKSKYLYRISKIDEFSHQNLLKFIRKAAVKEISRQTNGKSGMDYKRNIFK